MLRLEYDKEIPWNGSYYENYAARKLCCRLFHQLWTPTGRYSTHTRAICFSLLSSVLIYAFLLPFILFTYEQMENCNTVPYLYTHGMVTIPYQCFKFYSCFQVSVHRQHRVLNGCNSITKFYSSYDMTDAIQSFI
jgi:hypothetical protein